MEKLVGLRIDIDTVKGYKKGVIPILDLLGRYNIKASFFIPTGYDTPFRMFPRLFCERGFLRRLFRLKGSIVYNLLLSGDISFKAVVDYIKDEKHEIGLHGYHHFDWQLRLRNWSAKRTSDEISKAMFNFKFYTGFYPHSFASPGWITKAEVFLAEEKLHFDYCSDTRGKFPFYPVILKNRITILQIPVTLPTLDELIVLGKPNSLIDMNVKRWDVYCAHAEFDGMKYIRIFEKFLEQNLRKGYQFVPLSEIKRNVVDAPTSSVMYRIIPGRTNPVVCQKIEGLT